MRLKTTLIGAAAASVFASTAMAGSDEAVAAMVM